MNAFVPPGYEPLHWLAVVAGVFVIWEVLKFVRSKIKA